MRSKRKTLGLALGSGGAKGACHVGFLQVLVENHIPIDFISGCSMGAVVGGVYASGANLDEIEEYLRSIKQLELIDISIQAIKKAGFLRGDFACKLISKYLKCENVKDTIIPFKSVATDLLSGKLIIIDDGKLIDAIHASMAIPTIFQPVKIGDALCVDGGVLCRLPIAAVRSFNPDVVIAVDALGETRPIKEVKNIFELITRSFDIVDWAASKSTYKKADLTIIPDNYESNQYDAKFCSASIDAGRRVAEEYLPQIKELLK